MQADDGNGLQAVIFDFDGVVVDSEPLQCEVFQRVLAEEGIHITAQDHDERFLGINDWEGFPKAFAEVGRQLTADRVQALIERKSSRYLERAGEVRPFPGVPRLVEALALRFPLAIASGSRGHEIRAILKSNDLLKHFSEIISSDDVKRSKPAPDAYLKALAALRRRVATLEASSCLVVEDSIQGVRAARAAGMQCVAVAHSLPAERLDEADRVLQRLGEHSATDLLGLVG